MARSVKLKEEKQVQVIDAKALRKTRTYNDIDLNNWKEYDHLDVGTLWNFPSRAKGNGHSYDYHGNYIPQIAEQLFERYTRPGDIVLDMFMGSGTSGIEALNMNRRCVGVEIQKKMVEYVNEKFTPEEHKSVKIIHGDSSSESIVPHIKATLAGLEEKMAQFLVLHPPYADIIKFSDLDRDLSNYESVDEFLNLFKDVAQNGFDCLEKGKYATLIIGDKYTKGELIPLSFLCMQKMNEVGFKTKSIIVKNIEGNEKAKGKTANLWRYRALAGGFNIFKHEYVMVFQKK